MEANNPLGLSGYQGSKDERVDYCFHMQNLVNVSDATFF